MRGMRQGEIMLLNSASMFPSYRRQVSCAQPAEELTTVAMSVRKINGWLIQNYASLNCRKIPE